MLEAILERHPEYLRLSEADLPTLRKLHARGWLSVGCVQPTISRHGVVGGYSQEFIDHARGWVLDNLRLTSELVTQPAGYPFDIATLGRLVQVKFLGEDYRLDFKWDSRLSASLGRCRGCSISVTTALCNLDYPRYILGQVARSSQEAACLIVEHEITHYLTTKFDPESKPHGRLFREIARHLFGHTETSHEITQHNTNTTVSVGSRVRFPDGSTTSEGSVTKVNRKTADILTDLGCEKRVHLRVISLIDREVC